MVQPSSIRRVTTVVSIRERPVAVRIRHLTLEVVSGPDAGATAQLSRRELRIGTDPSNHLVLTDPEVSRFHCRLLAADHGYRAIDRGGSANGTRIGGVRIRDAFIPDGGKLEIGRTVISVRVGDDEHEIELSSEDGFGGVIGRSVAMRELFAVARRAAASNATVLILGETGTGKDLLARAIHDHSPRIGRPFVVFDCGAIAPTLVEAALFGHVKGAFTGAETDRPGFFEAAHGGTLFLDEIGELPLALQPKLLRALESGTVARVGGTEHFPVDVRFIAATNRDLREEVAAERFRSDLFYRLAVIPVEVPPLRDRSEDIPLLAAHFVRHLLVRGDADVSWMWQHLDDAFGGLTKHRWPGNVRELRNVIERAAALADPNELSKDGFSRLVAIRNSIAHNMHSRPPLAAAREQFDREYLREVLAAAQGDVTLAATNAQVHPKSFARLLRRYDISR